MKGLVAARGYVGGVGGAGFCGGGWAARARIEQPKAGATVQYLSPVPLAFRSGTATSRGRNENSPTNGTSRPGRSRGAEIQMLTVIVPFRAGKATDWNARRLESKGAVGARLEQNGKSLIVAFRKAHQPGAASGRHDLRQTRGSLCARPLGVGSREECLRQGKGVTP